MRREKPSGERAMEMSGAAAHGGGSGGGAFVLTIDDGVVADDDTGRWSHTCGGNHDGGDVSLDNAQHQMMVRVLMQIGFRFMFGSVRFRSSVRVGSFSSLTRFSQPGQNRVNSVDSVQIALDSAHLAPNQSTRADSVNSVNPINSVRWFDDSRRKTR
ncbi:hypothetical protein Hanom_Chr06g00496811 [Helianthus anomalus]